MFRPKNETEDLLLSITKKCEPIIHQTHKKAKETLEFEMTKPKAKYHFKPPIPVQGSWMIGIISLEVYNAFFNITEENNKFEIYTGYLEEEFSQTQLKEKVAEVLGLPNITSEELELETFGPKIIEIYRKLSMEKGQTDGYFLFLGDYIFSLFLDFES